MLSLPQLRQLNYGHPRLLRWRAAPLWHGMVRPVAKRTPSKLGSSVGMPRTSHDARTHDVVTANSNTHTGGDGNGVGIVHRRGGKDADDGRRDGKTAKRSAIIVDPLEVCISGRLASRTTVTHSLLFTTEAKVPRISCIYNCLGDSRLPRRRLHSILNSMSCVCLTSSGLGKQRSNSRGYKLKRADAPVQQHRRAHALQTAHACMIIVM